MAHVERFAVPAPGRVEVPVPGIFDVALAWSRRRLPITAHQSLLDVLLGAGVTCLNDCREGICASCETAVVRGTIDHRDFVLSTAEKEAGDVLLPCLSRAAGVELVLDL